MTWLVSALAFLLLLTVLILLHEFGHFWVARKAGVTVEEFGFGLPPKFMTVFKQKGTMFTLNWIPFGGFVRLKGENAETDSERRAPGSFSRASILARCAVLLAGVFMNFLFATLIFMYGFSVGNWIPTYVSFEEMREAAAQGEIHFVPGVVIDQVMPGGTALAAGVPAGSMLLKVDGNPVNLPSDVSKLQEGKITVTYTFLRSPTATKEEQLNVPVSGGKTGVGLRPYARELSAPDRSLVTAFVLSLREAKVMTVQTVIGLGTLFLSLTQEARVPEGITGIVGIAQLTHASVQEGLATYLRLVALLSLSLAVLNVLPFPALDGGRLLFVLAEAVLRRPLNRRFETTTNAVGFIVLILLIVIITYNDVIRLFWN